MMGLCFLDLDIFHRSAKKKNVRVLDLATCIMQLQLINDILYIRDRQTRQTKWSLCLLLIIIMISVLALFLWTHLLSLSFSEHLQIPKALFIGFLGYLQSQICTYKIDYCSFCLSCLEFNFVSLISFLISSVYKYFKMRDSSICTYGRIN